jgi:drug/metabolite transporter (DMT)-like permease
VGPVLCLFSAACFGAMAVFGKLAYQAGVTPGALLLLRFTLAAALLGVLLLLRPGLRAAPAASRSRSSGAGVTGPLVLTGLGLGAAGFATQATLYFSALERINASLVVLVLYTYPLLVTVAAALLGRECLTSTRAAALVLASCGTLLVLLGAGGTTFDAVGVALAFGSAVTYTGYILVADTVVHRLPPVVLAALVMAGAALTLAGRAVLTGGVDLDFGAAGWLWIGCITVISTVLAMLAFFTGLRKTGPSTVAILSTFEPVVTTALAALTLQEFLTPVQLAGALVVLSSAALVQLRRRRTPATRPAAVQEYLQPPTDPHALPSIRYQL